MNMFKKILILFLCFWISCGSVFAMNNKGVLGYPFVDSRTRRENSEQEENARISVTNYGTITITNGNINIATIHQNNPQQNEEANNNTGFWGFIKDVWNGFTFSIGGRIFEWFFPKEN